MILNVAKVVMLFFKLTLIVLNSGIFSLEFGDFDNDPAKLPHFWLILGGGTHSLQLIYSKDWYHTMDGHCAMPRDQLQQKS